MPPGWSLFFGAATRPSLNLTPCVERCSSAYLGLYYGNDIPGDGSGYLEMGSQVSAGFGASDLETKGF